MSEEKQDLLELAFSEAQKYTFEFKGSLYEVRPPSIQRQEALRLMAQKPVIDAQRKPVKQNGVVLTKTDASRYAALLVIETVYDPCTGRPVFEKAHLDRILAMPTDHGSFHKAAQPVIMKAMGVGEDDAPLEEQEEGNSEGAPASDS